MIPKTLIGLLLAGALLPAADVVVHVAPPAPLMEQRAAAPGPGYVWIKGYQSWNGSAFVWVPGRWEMPPRPHAHWVSTRWVKRNGGWVMVAGHWR